MAGRAEQVRPGGRTGRIVAGLVALCVVGPLAAVWLAAGQGTAVSAHALAALRFTLLQAVLSAALSVGLAIPLSRALWRRRFPGRKALILVMGAPFILPAIVAIFGLLGVFGRGGWMSAALGVLGLKQVSIYGLSGILIAHVFFNLPFVTRVLLHGWASIPTERFRLAASLGFGPRETRRYLEWPMLRELLPGAALAVFLVCVTSFTVALTLGGGPRATTLELAIYQSFRFDFDPGRAAVLATVQMVICAGAALLSIWVATPSGQGAGLDRQAEDWLGRGRLQVIGDGIAIALAAAFLILPLAVIVMDGLAAIPSLGSRIWLAALRSVAVSLAATAICTGAALAIATAVPYRGGRAVETAAMLPMASSALVFGTGLFLTLRGMVAPATMALPATVLANVLAALPFAVRVLAAEARRIEADYGRLADSLGMTGRARLRWLTLPRLRRQLGFSAGLAAALSIGDLGVIALFGDAAHATLPLVMYDLMGSYRMEAAAGVAVLLLGMSLAIFWLFDRWGQGGA